MFILFVAPASVADFASRLCWVSFHRSQSLHRASPICIMWASLRSIFFRNFLPQTALAIIRSTVNISPVPAEIISAFFKFSHVPGFGYFTAAYDFPWFPVCSVCLSLQVVCGYLPVSPLRTVSFSGRATVSPLPLHPFEAQGSPDCALSSILVVSCEKTGSFTNSAKMILQWNLRYSMFNIELYVGRRERHQIPRDSVHQAA